MKRSKAEHEHAAYYKKQLALLLLLAGLMNVREMGLFGRGDLPVLMCLIIEFESIISVCEVLFCLFLDFSVGFDPVKKHAAVVSVF